MNDENDKYFLLSVAVVLGLGLAVLSYFCGGEIMKYIALKITCFVFICVFLVFTAIFLGIILFSSKNTATNKDFAIITSQGIEDLKFDKDSVFLLNENSDAIPPNCKNIIVLKNEIKESDFFKTKLNETELLNLYITQKDTKIELSVLNSYKEKLCFYLCKDASILLTDFTENNKCEDTK